MQNVQPLPSLLPVLASLALQQPVQLQLPNLPTVRKETSQQLYTHFGSIKYTGLHERLRQHHYRRPPLPVRQPRGWHLPVQQHRQQLLPVQSAQQ